MKIANEHSATHRYGTVLQSLVGRAAVLPTRGATEPHLLATGMQRAEARNARYRLPLLRGVAAAVAAGAVQDEQRALLGAELHKLVKESSNADGVRDIDPTHVAVTEQSRSQASCRAEKAEAPGASPSYTRLAVTVLSWSEETAHSPVPTRKYA